MCVKKQSRHGVTKLQMTSFPSGAYATFLTQFLVSPLHTIFRQPPNPVAPAPSSAYALGV